MYVFIFLLIQMSIEKIKNENILIKEQIQIDKY